MLRKLLHCASFLAFFGYVLWWLLNEPDSVKGERREPHTPAD